MFFLHLDANLYQKSFTLPRVDLVTSLRVYFILQKGTKILIWKMGVGFLSDLNVIIFFNSWNEK